MPHAADQILTAAQMRGAEEALIAGGVSVDDLMQRAGQGAADYVWRIAAGRRVTVLCGPGNNGGDGYVIAEAIRHRGGKVDVLAAAEPKTAAAGNARALYSGNVLAADACPQGDILVDCLFGSGLTRPLSPAHAALLALLTRNHRHCIAIDVPSGVQSDNGMLLGVGRGIGETPAYDMTIALGAWKFAHFLMPATAIMGAMRLVGIGAGRVAGAAKMVTRPAMHAPAADSHKYRRGLLAVIGGVMPGAAQLAAKAAQGAGAGYVKLFAPRDPAPPADIVVDSSALLDALGDARISAVLAGPGLGRHADSRKRLETALAADCPAVIDADALMLLNRSLLTGRTAPAILTPHDGELQELERAFGLRSAGSKLDRATALAQSSGMVVVAKGPDTVIVAPDGRMACAPRASSWLSVAGTGDVLAGTIASRLAAGSEAFDAACEGVWLHGEAARLCAPAFTAGQLAEAIPAAFAACL